MIPIKHTELPTQALKLISKRQRSYIDEFKFFRLENGDILAQYAEEDLAVWNGKEWKEKQAVSGKKYVTHI